MNTKKIFLIIVVLLLPGYPYGQVNDSFKREFENIANVFEDNIKPYLKNFAEVQINPGSDSITRQNAFKAQYFLFEQKVKNLRSESFEELSKKTESINEDFLLGYFTFLYSIEFPGLDYQYFKNCNDQIKKAGGTKSKT